MRSLNGVMDERDAPWFEMAGEALTKKSAAQAVGDAQFVEQGLGFEVRDPDRGGFAISDGSMLRNLDVGIAAGDSEVHQRRDPLAFGKKRVVAETSEVEHLGQSW